MSATLMRLNVYRKSLSKWHHVVQPSFIYSQRALTTRTGNLCGDATAAATEPKQQPQQQLRKIELKEPIGTDRLRKCFDNEIRNGECVPVFKRALLHGNRIAVKDNTGEYSYRQILDGARKLATQLSAYNSGKCACVSALVSTNVYRLFLKLKNRFSQWNKSGILVFKFSRLLGGTMGMLDQWTNR